MNRREIVQRGLVAFAAIPLLGWFVAPAVAEPTAAPVVAVPQPIRLASVRDLLLPGLYSHDQRAGHDIELDIHIDYANDCLLVKGYAKSKNRLLGFAITRHSIETGRYKTQFNSAVLKLIHCLKWDDEIRGAA